MKSLYVKTQKKVSDFCSQKPRTFYYLIYSITFISLALCVFSYFLEYGKSFVWIGSSDGLSQHFNSLAYFGTYLRDLFSGFLHGNFVIPMWDFSIGYGSDIMTTLHYYAIGDPLNFLSVFFKPEQTELLYCALVVVRLYLSGLAFSMFSRKMKCSNYGTFLGAIVYAFCGFALYASVRHPYFINSMIYLPLLLIGIEKIFNKERPYFFIAMVFLSVVSNFYFFYVLSVLIIVYIAFRFFMIYKENIVSNFFKNVGKFGGFYITGFAMGCFIFIPVAMLTLSSNRASAETATHAFYESGFYSNFIAAFIGGKWNTDWTCLSFAPIALSCVFLLFAERKKNTHLKIMFALLTILAMMPLAGKVLNGFSYVTNRWMFAYAFLMSFIVAAVAPQIKRLSGKKIATLSVLTIAYLAFMTIVPWAKTPIGVATCFLFFATSAVFVLSFFFQKHWKGRSKNTVVNFTRIALVFVTVIGILINANIRYSANQGNYTEEFVDFGDSFSLLTNTESRAIKELPNSEFFRYEIDSNDATMQYNSAIQNGTYGTDYYFSLVDSSVSNYMGAMRFTRSNDATYAGFDGRAYLSTVASSKYYVSETENLTCRPFGYYEKVAEMYSEKADLNYYVFENENALPFGFTYSSYVENSDFEKMTVTEKQQAVLQCAVGDFGNAVGGGSPHFSEQEIDYSVGSSSDGIEIKDGEFVVSKKNAEIVFNFQSLENSETYLLFDDLVFDDGKKRGDYGSIEVAESDTSHQIRINTTEYSWYTGNHDFLTNLGYSQKSKTTVNLTFKNKGTYSFNSMKIVSQPMDNLKIQSNNLKEDVLQNVAFEANRVTGKIALEVPKVLCMSIPFNDGWSAYVDGEKTELKACGIMFSGIELSPGEHTVELKYKTPFLELGIFVSAIGVLSTVGIVIYIEKYRKKHKN